MTTIHTDEDVIRVIRENPRLLFQALYEDGELREEVRRLVLTEAVLEMPAQLSELSERQGRMETRMDGVEDHLGRLTGAELESRIIGILPSRLNSMYGLYRTRVIQGRGVVSKRKDDFDDSMDDAVGATVISDRQRRRVAETDMIVRARRRSGQDLIYIAVEASVTIRRGDITRANDTADTLRAVFGVESVAVAVGYDVRLEDRSRAESLGVGLIILEGREQDASEET
jgi:hypothetical protein